MIIWRFSILGFLRNCSEFVEKLILVQTCIFVKSWHLKTSVVTIRQPTRDNRIELIAPEPFKENLNCSQRALTLTFAEVQQRLEHTHSARIDPASRTAHAADVKKRSAGKAIRGISYDMRGFFR